MAENYNVSRNAIFKQIHIVTDKLEEYESILHLREKNVKIKDKIKNISSDLRNEIEKLDPEDRKLIKLRYYQDKSQQETSKELGINQVQVSRRENKILVKLNQKLAS